MKLTKDQRFTAYCILLARVEEFEKMGIDYFLCVDISHELGINVAFNDLKLSVAFPELYAKKPSKNHFSGGWFHEKDYNSRKEILKQCIAETSNF